MQSLTEKRVYGDRGGARSCFVASETGLVQLLVTGTAVGEFSLVDRRSARDVAVGSAFDADGTDDRAATVAVATETDVLVGAVSKEGRSNADAAGTTAALSDPLEPTDFGPSVAVDVGSESVVAAGPDGTVRRYDPSESTWRTIDGPAKLAVAAIDAPMIATDRGVYRIVDDTLRPAGLVDVRDVDASGTPLAATASGLYVLGNGWQSLLADPIDAVSTAPSPDRDAVERIHAVSGATLVAVDAPGRNPTDSDQGGGDAGVTSHTVVTAEEPLVDLAYGAGNHVYAISASGAVLAAGPEEVRRHVLGVRDATAISFCGPANPQ